MYILREAPEHLRSARMFKKTTSAKREKKNRNYEDKMDTELIDTIKGTIYKIWQMKERIAQLKEQRKPIPSYLPN